MLKMILAMDKDNLVGKTASKNGLAWHYPEDLQYYKEQTLGKINVMGRKTFSAIGRPLPNRKTIVLTRDKNYSADGIDVINSLESVLELAQDQEVIICGGVSVYRQFNQFADEIYITKIDDSHTGDIYYEDLDLKNFRLKSEKTLTNKKISYQVWERK